MAWPAAYDDCGPDKERRTGRQRGAGRRDTVKKPASKPGRPRGRPVEYPLPEAIPDTPENVMRRLLAAPPRREHAWDYVQRSGRVRKRK